MSEPTPPAVVTKAITVRCPLALAFRVWTAEIDCWWPKGHSLSGDPATEVRLEEQVGGRFYERTAAGVEHRWGEITAWDPPHSLAFTWYLGTSPQQPSKVEVNFLAIDETYTQVKIEHRGPEWIGDLWATRSPRFAAGWTVVLRAYGGYSEVVKS
ncbi:MAG: SRPBCC domain-containing protein [Caldilineaceae bacterium]